MAFSYLCTCSLLICSLLAFLVSGSQIQKTFLPVISFDEGYTQLFGDDNLAIHRDGKTVHLSLDERTGTHPSMVSILGFRVMFYLLLLCVGFHWEFLCGFLYAGSGFVSQDLYLHGFFSASIKLPADYTAGVVVAFYVSRNTD